MKLWHGLCECRTPSTMMSHGGEVANLYVLIATGLSAPRHMPQGYDWAWRPSGGGMGLWPTCFFFQLGLRLKLKGRWLRGFHRAEAMVTDGKNDLPDPSGERVRPTRGRGHDDNRQGVLTSRALAGSRQDISTRALMTLGSNRPNPYFVP